MNAFAISLISVLAVASSAFLTCWRPELFTWSATIPATLVYFGAFATIFSVLRVVPKRRLPWSGSGMAEASRPKTSGMPGWVAELLFHLAFSVVGVIAGMIAGTTWWMAGGYDVRSLAEALKIGAILGGAVILLLFGA